VKDKNIKNILVNINKSYVSKFLTTMNSLSCNNTNSTFDVYIMHSNLNKKDKELIKNHLAGNINPIYIFMDEKLFKGAPKVKRYPYEIYYRIFAPIMLPKNIDRVLYLDCDLIVHNNIDSLYNMNFDGNYFIACTQIQSFLQWFNRIRLTVGKSYYYINTGVMLINLKDLRSVINIDKIFKFIKHNGWRMALYDQDVIFKFFGNKVKLIDTKKYNLSDRHIMFHNKFYHSKFKIDIDWVENNNIIIHYLGKNKPWNNNYKGILSDYYSKYRIDL